MLGFGVELARDDDVEDRVADEFEALVGEG